MAATIGTLAVNIIAKTRDFNKGMGRARRSLRGFSGTVKRAISSVGGLAAGLSVTGLAGFAIKTAAAFETTETKLQVLLGSVEKAKTLMGQLQKFAAGTPFQFQDIATGASSLLAFGRNADTILPTLRTLGDVAAGSGTRLSEVVQIFGKMSATGRATLENINELSLRQIPIWTVLKERLGKTADEIRTMASRGKLSFAIIEDALKSMSDKGGLFFGALQKQSKTLAGRWSTLKDNVSLLANAIGNRLLPNIKAITTTFTEWVQSVKDVNGSMDTLLFVVTKLGRGIILAFKAVQEVLTFVAAYATRVIADLASGIEIIFNKVDAVISRLLFISAMPIDIASGAEVLAKNMEEAAHKTKKEFEELWKNAKKVTQIPVPGTPGTPGAPPVPGVPGAPVPGAPGAAVDSVQRMIDALKRQKALLGKTTTEIKLWEAAQSGATKEQLRQIDTLSRWIDGQTAIDALTNKWKQHLTDAGAALTKEFQTPLEKAQEKLKEFQELLKFGVIKKRVFVAAAMKAVADLKATQPKNVDTGRRATLAEKGTAEAFRAIRNVKGNAAAKLQRVNEQQLNMQKKGFEKLADILLRQKPIAEVAIPQ